MAWVQRPSGLIRMEGSASAFGGSYLRLGREYFMEANINNQSKSFSNTTNLQHLTQFFRLDHFIIVIFTNAWKHAKCHVIE
jgi:hypothetical protein